MVKSFLTKKKSKRMTCRRKYKIERKVREHNRKVRKETKSKQKSGHKRKPDVQVPNKCPFKDEILREAIENKLAEEANRVKQREALKDKRKKKEKKLSEKRKLPDLLKDAHDRQQEYATKALPGSSDTIVREINASKAAENSLKVYHSEVKKVIERADVVVQVLDARDPLGSRSGDLEKSVIESGKRLILLLNKIDLIPKENVIAWLKYLRSEFPTVAFEASTQEQSKNLLAVTNISLDPVLGKVFKESDISYPNVGKSSVINSLKRKAACNVGAQPGITKALQEVHLDKKIRLIDSPGVALCSKDSYDQIEMALKNVTRIDLLEDPISPVEAILRRCAKDSLMLQYTIGDFADVDELLSQIARKIGRLKKGGVPDKRMAAKKVLHDWNAGKIRYYTVPPETASGVQLISSEIVTEMGKEFDIDSIEADQKLLVDDLPSMPPPASMVLPAWKDVVQIDAGEEMQIDGSSGSKCFQVDNSTSVNSSSTNSFPFCKSNDTETVESGLEGNLKRNKSVKLQFKKDKKKRKRADKLATNLSNAFEGAMDLDDRRNDGYSFETDYH